MSYGNLNIVTYYYYITTVIILNIANSKLSDRIELKVKSNIYKMIHMLHTYSRCSSLDHLVKRTGHRMCYEHDLVTQMAVRHSFISSARGNRSRATFDAQTVRILETTLRGAPNVVKAGVGWTNHDSLVAVKCDCARFVRYWTRHCFGAHMDIQRVCVAGAGVTNCVHFIFGDVTFIHKR